MWLELEVDSNGQEIRVTGRGSRGERPPGHTIPGEQGAEAFQAFANKIGRAIRSGKSLDLPVIAEAQALHEAIFQGELRDVLVRLGEAAAGGRVLVRLFLRDRALQSIPWEALCKPGTTEGFLGTDPRILLARGVASPDPWEPREVRGAVRVLAVAPGSDERALGALREALAPAIESGEVEWLEPIAGDTIGPRVLYDRLRRGKTPHVLHFLGHGGVDLKGRPTLRMADDEDGEEVWLTAEALARELSAIFYEDLRLVILEACEGARAGALGSAAEALAAAGADAVVAHLWPVKVDVARACSSELYRALTGAEQSLGDVGAAVAAARRTLLAESAEAFSPVLFLRGASSVIFDFEGRRVARAGPGRRRKAIAPALAGLLERPFTMVLGDLDEDRGALQKELSQFMEQNGDETTAGMSLSALTQRCALRFGLDVLHSLFQQALIASLKAPPPPLVSALGQLVPPGVHITLLWRPYLERSIEANQPHRTIYAVQPSLLSSGGKPRIVKRAAGATQWRMEPAMPRGFDFEDEIVVLRLYGGYSPEPLPIFSHPLLTEDEHISGFLGAEGFRPPSWMQELLARPRMLPGLFVGLSVLEWRHRMLLRWLYDERPAPKDSLAILPPDADRSEPEIWESGGGLPGTGRIASIREDPAQLASLLDHLPLGEAV